MKNILIIEDDELKYSRLKDYLMTKISDCEITNARSKHSGLQTVISSKPDLILLDMSLPNFDITPDEDGGRPQGLGGKEILRQLSRRKISIPVIVVTQFDSFGEPNDSMSLKELTDELKQSFPENFKGTVYYHATLEDWKEQLWALINYNRDIE